MARALKEVAGGAGGNDEYFARLADQAVTECGRTITIVLDALPAEPFLVLTKPERGTQLRVLATAATVLEAQTKATDHLQREGIGSVSLAEIKRVLTVVG
jgi:hypothetical protein